MSLKENVDYIKEELSSEEKFLESSLKAEKFYKKYKYLIFGIVGVAIAFFVITGIIDYQNNKTKQEANIAYENIMNDPKDLKSLDKLKSLNSKLYEIALLKTNKANTTSVLYLKELQEYKNAIKSGDLATLDRLIASQDFLLKDFASINKAIIYIEKNQFDKAKFTLKTIPSDSQVAQLVTLIEHFLITK
jgi:predicted negative regulator of RcsB-dependent stress response